MGGLVNAFSFSQRSSYWLWVGLNDRDSEFHAMARIWHPLRFWVFQQYRSETEVPGSSEVGQLSLRKPPRPRFTAVSSCGRLRLFAKPMLWKKSGRWSRANASSHRPLLWRSASLI